MVKVAIAQLNPTVGAFLENTDKIMKAYVRAEKEGADILCVSKYAVSGYPLFDLEKDADFREAHTKTLDEIAKKTKGKKVRLCMEEGLFFNIDVRFGKDSFMIDAEAVPTKGRGDFLVHAALFGGQDEAVFDGGSFIADKQGRVIARLKRWQEDFAAVDLAGKHDEVFIRKDILEDIWQAGVLSIRDYVCKTRFTDVVLGLSGGIDSAVVAAMAGDALGPKHVHCYRLPSVYTSDLSNEAADAFCKIWNMPLSTISISNFMESFETVLQADGLTKENLQARVRGLILMGIANRDNRLMLNTSNKSEAAVGYSTLYGDTCGAYGPLKDIYKTTVSKLAKFRNAYKPDNVLGPTGIVIPEEIIARPPTAELRPHQKDEDSLPPYDVLDEILGCLIEKGLSVREIIKEGYDEKTVLRIHMLLNRFEFKRRQEPPGLEISKKALGSGRVFPMTHSFKAGL